MSAGYSSTSLTKKLGIKSGDKIRLVHAPGDYFSMFTDMPPVTLLADTTTKKDFIHYFAINAKDLQVHIAKLRNEIVEDGMIWVSWYKKAANIPTDVTEELIRSLALANGLVDVKVCAVNEQWSGLKLVIPLKDRKL